MVRHALKILQQMLQDFESVPHHFTALRSKGLSVHKYLWFDLILRRIFKSKELF